MDDLEKRGVNETDDPFQMGSRLVERRNIRLWLSRIASQKFAKPIRHAVDQYAPLWKQHRSPAIAFAAALVLTVLLGLLAMRPSHKASTLLTITEEQIQSEWDLLKDETRDVDFEEQIRSRAVIGQALRQLGVFPPPKHGWWNSKTPLAGRDEQLALARAVDAFQKRLTVERLKHSGILRLTVVGRSPQQAADAANAVARSFIDLRRAKAILRTEQSLAALDRELGTARAQLDRYSMSRSALPEPELKNVRQAAPIESESRKPADSSQDLQRPIGTTEVVTPATASNATDKLAVQVQSIEVSEVRVGSSLDELAKQLAAADGQLSRAISRYKEGTPLVLQARREKEALEAVLRQRTLEHWAAREQQLAYANAQQRYQELLDQRAKVHLTLTELTQPSTTFGNLSILDEALPPHPRSFLASLVLLAVGGVTLAAAGLVIVPLLLTFWQARPDGSHLASRLSRDGLGVTPALKTGADGERRTKSLQPPLQPFLHEPLPYHASDTSVDGTSSSGQPTQCASS